MNRRRIERKYSRRTEVWKNDMIELADSYERRISRLKALVEGYKKNSIELSEMYHRRLDVLKEENVQLKGKLYEKSVETDPILRKRNEEQTHTGLDKTLCKCEMCGKDARWKFCEGSMKDFVSRPSNTHNLCDECFKKIKD